jgi:prophage antirepressor-like protein
MTAQLIIKQFETNEITMIQDNDNEVWFKAHDVATVLGYKCPSDAISQHVDSEDKQKMNELTTTVKYDTSKIKKNIVFINESGLYSLIMRSKLESSKQFKRWVTKEVLPAIRKTGSYTMPIKDTGTYIQEALMIEDITHPKIQMLLYDRLSNELQGSGNQEPKEQWSRDIITILKEEFNKNLTFTDAAVVGRFVIKRYRFTFKKEPKKSSKYVNGNTRKVFAYTQDEEKHVIRWIRDFYR